MRTSTYRPLPYPDLRGRGRQRQWHLPVTMAVLLPLVGLLASWPLAAGWLAPAMAQRWTQALLATADVGAFRDLTGTAYPVLPLALDMLVAALPGLGGMPPPLLVNVLALTLAAGLWARMMVAAGHGFGWSLIMAGLLATMPAISLPVVAGGVAPLGLLPFTIVVAAALRLQREQEINAMISLGTGLAILALTDPAGAYIVLAAVPFLALLLPPRLIAVSASGSLLVVLFPLIFTSIALCYVNWVFGGSPLAFANGVDAAIRGSAAHVGASLWLMGWGGQWGTALVAGTGLMAAVTPISVVALWQAPGGDRRVLAVLAGTLLVALTLASATWFLGDPGRILAYLAPIAALGIAVAGPSRLPGWLLVILGLLGLAAGWWTQGTTGDQDTRVWRSSLIGEPATSETMAGEMAVGQFLRGLDNVAIDGLSAGAVVPTRGTARGLLLPSNDRLKADLIAGRIRATYLAMRDPGSPAGTTDRIAQAKPDLWQDAGPGAALVYDKAGWRVWRLPDERAQGE